MSDTRYPLTLCWHCHRMLDSASGLNAKTPHAGDISLCLYCGVIAVFGPDLIRSPPDEELLEKLESDKDFIQIFMHFQWTRQKVMLHDSNP